MQSESENVNEDGKKERCVDVRLDLIPLKLFYFAFLGGHACIMPFLSVYYRYLGLSARQSGIIQSAGQFITLLAPVFGLLGDKLKNPKFVWITCLLGQIEFGMLIWFVLNPNANIQEMRLYCDCNESRNWTTDSLPFNCNNFRFWEGEWIKFVEVLLLVLGYQAMIGPTPGISDAFALEVLGERRQGDYGKQRAWGAVGWGVYAVAIGIISNLTSKCGHTNYAIHYYIFGGMLGLSVVFALFVRPRTEVVHQEVNLKRSLIVLFSQLDVAIFLFGVFLSGVVTTIVDNFLFWFLEDLGGGQLIMGLSLLTMCIGEVIVFVPSGWIIRIIGNHVAVLVSLLVFAVRFIGYSFLSNPWFVLLIEPLHGVTFGLLKTAIALYMRIVTPVDMQSGAQTVAFGIQSGLGKGIGNIVAGVVWHHFGAVWTFRGAAVLSTVGGGLFWIMHLLAVRAQRLERKHLDERTRLVSDDQSSSM